MVFRGPFKMTVILNRFALLLLDRTAVSGIIYEESRRSKAMDGCARLSNNCLHYVLEKVTILPVVIQSANLLMPPVS